ncbi:GNAT family N-acetyltransferase [Asticcacaulis tiandongensis]|uniref:GNAT family N-acetyltransferase n=1 Tax=Asticcacaulis tiandongensis TaxID=2565365 RepID=UPI00112A755B|nr:GNAT family N-acetyltransferase [Asticcacaulis tiandongensis]
MRSIRQLSEVTPQLSEIHAASFDFGWSASDFHGMLTRPHYLTYGIYDDTQLKSFVVLSLIAGEGEILTLATDTNCRRQGLARDLMRFVIDRLKAENCDSLFLEVAVDNPAALNLYETLGFHRTGLRKAYYSRLSGPPVDGYALRLELKRA